MKLCFEPLNQAVVMKNMFAQCQSNAIIIHEFLEAYAATAHARLFNFFRDLPVLLNSYYFTHFLNSIMPLTLLYYYCISISPPHYTLTFAYAEWIFLMISVLIAYSTGNQSHKELNCQTHRYYKCCGDFAFWRIVLIIAQHCRSRVLHWI